MKKDFKRITAEDNIDVDAREEYEAEMFESLLEEVMTDEELEAYAEEVEAELEALESAKDKEKQKRLEARQKRINDEKKRREQILEAERRFQLEQEKRRMEQAQNHEAERKKDEERRRNDWEQSQKRWEAEQREYEKQLEEYQKQYLEDDQRSPDYNYSENTYDHSFDHYDIDYDYDRSDHIHDSVGSDYDFDSDYDNTERDDYQGSEPSYKTDGLGAEDFYAKQDEYYGADELDRALSNLYDQEELQKESRELKIDRVELKAQNKAEETYYGENRIDIAEAIMTGDESQLAQIRRAESEKQYEEFKAREMEAQQSGSYMEKQEEIQKEIQERFSQKFTLDDENRYNVETKARASSNPDKVIVEEYGDSLDGRVESYGGARALSDNSISNAFDKHLEEEVKMKRAGIKGKDVIFGSTVGRIKHDKQQVGGSVQESFDERQERAVDLLQKKMDRSHVDVDFGEASLVGAGGRIIERYAQMMSSYADEDANVREFNKRVDYHAIRTFGAAAAATPVALKNTALSVQALPAFGRAINDSFKDLRGIKDEQKGRYVPKYAYSKRSVATIRESIEKANPDIVLLERSEIEDEARKLARLRHGKLTKVDERRLTELLKLNKRGVLTSAERNELQLLRNKMKGLSKQDRERLKTLEKYLGLDGKIRELRKLNRFSRSLKRFTKARIRRMLSNSLYVDPYIASALGSYQNARTALYFTGVLKRGGKSILINYSNSWRKIRNLTTRRMLNLDPLEMRTAKRGMRISEFMRKKMGNLRRTATRPIRAGMDHVGRAGHRVLQKTVSKADTMARVSYIDGKKRIQGAIGRQNTNRIKRARNVIKRRTDRFTRGIRRRWSNLKSRISNSRLGRFFDSLKNLFGDIGRIFNKFKRQIAVAMSFVMSVVVFFGVSLLTVWAVYTHIFMDEKDLHDVAALLAWKDYKFVEEVMEHKEQDDGKLNRYIVELNPKSYNLDNRREILSMTAVYFDNDFTPQAKTAIGQFLKAGAEKFFGDGIDNRVGKYMNQLHDSSHNIHYETKVGKELLEKIVSSYTLKDVGLEDQQFGDTMTWTYSGKRDVWHYLVEQENEDGEKEKVPAAKLVIKDVEKEKKDGKITFKKEEDKYVYRADRQQEVTYNIISVEVLRFDEMFDADGIGGVYNPEPLSEIGVQELGMRPSTGSINKLNRKFNIEDQKALLFWAAVAEDSHVQHLIKNLDKDEEGNRVPSHWRKMTIEFEKSKEKSLEDAWKAYETQKEHVKKEYYNRHKKIYEKLVDLENINSSKGFIYPHPKTYPRGDGFGKYDPENTGVLIDHRGLDIRAPEGTDILAIADGTVHKVGSNKVRGNFVEIRAEHDPSILYVFMHMNGPARVRQNQKVKQGTVVGHVGNTGYSFGPHLHVAIIKNGNFVDPDLYIPQSTDGTTYFPAADYDKDNPDWEGWTTENREWAKTIYVQNWEDRYGLKNSTKHPIDVSKEFDEDEYRGYVNPPSIVDADGNDPSTAKEDYKEALKNTTKERRKIGNTAINFLGSQEFLSEENAPQKFISKIFKISGFNLEGNVFKFWDATDPIEKGDLKVGDLGFANKPGVGHVKIGIYIDNDQYIGLIPTEEGMVPSIVPGVQFNYYRRIKDLK